MLRRLRKCLQQPVAWGAVLLSYTGIIVSLAFAIFTYTGQADAIDRASAASRRTIVETGRDAIRNSCEYDNEQMKGLKANLRLFLADHEALHEHVMNDSRHTAGPARMIHSNVVAIERSIDSLTARDCMAAASTLTDNPKEK